MGTQMLVENLDPDLYYDVEVSAIYPGNIMSTPSTGKTATNGEQCSCRSYLISQRSMDRTIRSLVKAVQALSDKMDMFSPRRERKRRSIPDGFTQKETNPFDRYYKDD